MESGETNTAGRLAERGRHETDEPRPHETVGPLRNGTARTARIRTSRPGTGSTVP